MAVATGQTTTRLAEADASFLGVRESERPPGNRPRAFTLSATRTALTQALNIGVFSFRNPSDLTASVVRYMRFAIFYDTAAAPSAQTETGMELFIARRWTGTVTAPATLPDSPVPSRKNQKMEMPREAKNTLGTGGWLDIRLPQSATGNNVLASNTADQLEMDAQPFLVGRYLELLAGAAVPKFGPFEIVFDARDPGVYPLVLEGNEGVILYPSNAWTATAIDLTVQMEWEEIPMNELEAYV